MQSTEDSTSTIKLAEEVKGFVTTQSEHKKVKML